jgi:nucleotide-binding universal stress UspA family protein
MDKRIAPGSIVVAVDGSEHAERAVRWGTAQAELEHRPLIVVSVAEWGRLRDASFSAGVTLEELKRGARSIAEDAATLALKLSPQITVQATGLLGDPRQVLVDGSTDAHLVVMGSRGRGPLRSMLLGSVSSAVVKQARCPVVVCRSDFDRAQGAGVVVGADGTAESLPVIAFAFEVASLRGLSLTVLHAYWDAVTALAELRATGPGVWSEADVQDLHVMLSQSVAGFRARYPQVDVSLRLAHGLVDDVLVRDHSWDLVVVGRHPVDTVGRVVVGSIANAVLERAHTTVAMVPQASTSVT